MDKHKREKFIINHGGSLCAACEEDGGVTPATIFYELNDGCDCEDRRPDDLYDDGNCRVHYIQFCQDCEGHATLWDQTVGASIDQWNSRETKAEGDQTYIYSYDEYISKWNHFLVLAKDFDDAMLKVLDDYAGLEVPDESYMIRFKVHRAECARTRHGNRCDEIGCTEDELTIHPCQDCPDGAGEHDWADIDDSIRGLDGYAVSYEQQCDSCGATRKLVQKPHAGIGQYNLFWAQEDFKQGQSSIDDWDDDC